MVSYKLEQGAFLMHNHIPYPNTSMEVTLEIILVISLLSVHLMMMIKTTILRIDNSHRSMIYSLWNISRTTKAIRSCDTSNERADFFCICWCKLY